MKLTTLLLTVAVLHVAARGMSQTITFSGKDVPLKKLFGVIRDQTGFMAFYDDAVLDGSRPVTVSAKDLPLSDFLTEILKGQALEFNIQRTTIFIKKAAVPVGGGASSSPGKTEGVSPGDIHGRVTDSTGAPLAGASVTIKGNKKGTETDLKGEFVLKGVEDDAALVVSFTGYEQQVVRANTDRMVHVVLKHSDNPLDQVQIIAYGTSSRRMLTGDVSTVKSTEIEEQPVTDPLLALEGRVPGLYIQQTSGIPGAYSTVRIMGQNSIANGNDPLYVVDGVPYSSLSISASTMAGGAVGAPTSNYPYGTWSAGLVQGVGLSPFNELNPADIESIEVLKDADATAIYGSRGANGVILITTKKGKAGTTKIDVNLFGGSSKISRQINLLNTQQYLEMRHEAYLNDGITTLPANAYDLNGDWDTTRYTNWQKILIGNPAHFANAQVSVSGGNNYTQFFLSGTYSRQGTVFPGNYADTKGTGTMNLTHSSADRRLNIQAKVSYTYDNSNLPDVDLTSSIRLAPDAPALYNAYGNLNWQLHNGTSTWNNPFAYRYLGNTGIVNNLVTSLNLGYELLPGLRLNANAGYTHTAVNEQELQPGTIFQPPPNNISQNSLNQFATNDVQTWILEPQVSYQKNWGKGQLNALAGSTFQQNVQDSKAVSAEGFSSDALINNPTAASFQQISGDVYSKYHYAALFGRLGYNWNRKYLINFTARRDGSSRFGPGKQFGNFGSAGLGWIFSEEKFTRNELPFLSFGKLRTSYGITGNDQIADYQYLSSYSTVTGTYQGNTGLTVTRIANPYYSWEAVKKLQVGLDLGFFKDRILFSGSWYRNRDNNQLVGYPLSSVTGFGSIQSNFPATVQNTGEEFSVSASVIRHRNFSWYSSLNLTLPQSKLVAFPNFQNSGYEYDFTVGHSLYSAPRFQYAGVNSQTGQYEFYSPTYKTDTINPVYLTDFVPTKPITQQFYGGWQNSLSYKGIQLDIFIQFVRQRGMNYESFFPAAGTVGYNQPTIVLGRWQRPGDKTNIGKFSSSSQADPEEDLSSSTYPITDASFVRLKNVALSWQLPGDWQKKARLQNARVYLQCQNLITWTKYLGLDPETQGLHLPPMRTVTVALQVTL